MADQFAAAHPRLSRRPGAHPDHRRAGGARRGVRRRLVQQPAVHAVAHRDDDRAAAVAHRRLRQRRRVSRRRADLRPSSARWPATAPSLSGKMHFCRPRPVARVRGAADHRHLSRRTRLDPGLDAAGCPAGMVPHHGQRHAGRAVRAHQPDRLRRGSGLLRAQQHLFDIARGSDRAAVLHGGVAQPPARPVHHSANPGGAVIAIPTCRRGRRGRCRPTTRTRRGWRT